MEQEGSQPMEHCLRENCPNTFLPRAQGTRTQKRFCSAACRLAHHNAEIVRAVQQFRKAKSTA